MGAASVLERARSVLEDDRRAIESAGASLGQGFVDAVSILLKTSGKTLVTGMGTSGAVARRIAHLLSCGGTPAVFVSAADGLHGGLGAVANGDEGRRMLDALRQEVCHLNQELPRNGLAAWTTGNLSARDPESGLIVIKPSGVRYEAMSSEAMVVIDIDGVVVEGSLQPSVDAASHLYVYRHRPDVNGVVHTHSPYATAFAAVGRPLPVYLTAMADQFGGAVPVGAYVAPVGGEAIGAEILASIGDSPAILMQNHGVFTIGATATAALQAAIMLEENAKTIAIALAVGTPTEIPAEHVERQREFYLTEYGQRRQGPSRVLDSSG